MLGVTHPAGQRFLTEEPALTKLVSLETKAEETHQFLYTRQYRHLVRIEVAVCYFT